MIKRPKDGSLRYGWGDYVYTKAKIIYTNANEYDHFVIDAAKLGNGFGFLSLSKHPYIHKPKWEISMRFYEHNEYIGYDFTLRKDVTIDYGLRYKGANSADTGVVWHKGNKEPLKLTVTDGAIELISLSSGKVFFKYEDSTIRKNELKYVLVAIDGDDENAELIIKAKVDHTRVTTTSSTSTRTTIPTTTPTTAPDEESTVTITTTTTTTPKTTQSSSPSSDRKFQPFT